MSYFYTPWKRQRFSDVFRGYRNGTLPRKGLTHFMSLISFYWKRPAAWNGLNYLNCLHFENLYLKLTSASSGFLHHLFLTIPSFFFWLKFWISWPKLESVTFFRWKIVENINHDWHFPRLFGFAKPLVGLSRYLLLQIRCWLRLRKHI